MAEEIKQTIKTEVKKKEAIAPLLKVLAQLSPEKSRKLLKDYGKDDAKNMAELEVKLADLYRTYPDKLEIEKHFADIFPFKDFILKYNKSVTLDKDPILHVTNKDAVVEKKSNCEGCGGTCGGERKANACGCSHSSFEGEKKDIISETSIILHKNTNVILAGLLGLGMLALFLHHKKA